MNAVTVTGISMRPFLVTGDVLLLKEVKMPPPFGSLVLVTKDNGEKSVHRYLGKNLVKGDRCKYWDNVISIDSLVVERMSKNKWISLTGRWSRWTLGVLSLVNLKSNFIIHHFAAAMIAFFGKVGRIG